MVVVVLVAERVDSRVDVVAGVVVDFGVLEVKTVFSGAVELDITSWPVGDLDR